MPSYKTPGVYIEEIQPRQRTVADVGTAIPAFVGHTQKAQQGAVDDLRLKPTLVRSLAEYEALFGGPHPEPIEIGLASNDKTLLGYDVVTYKVGDGDVLPKYLLHWAVRLFFDNGGGQCYIVSIGGYADPIELGDAQRGLRAGLARVAIEDEPTLLVIPEAVKLAFAEYQSLSREMLAQCDALGDRFAILDVWGGHHAMDDEIAVSPGGDKYDLITLNRGAWAGGLKYAAAYYPFLETASRHFVASDASNVKVAVNGAPAAALATFATTNRKVFDAATAALEEHRVVMPPSGAVAGVYAAVDGARGVWKAPANVALAAVLEPVVQLDAAQQDRLNVDAADGKSVNAIRAFAGRGTLVWGARTLAGNDNEWRYVSVRRFVNLVEESVKRATQWAVFESNDASLWVKVRGMIENYLIDKWRAGALAGGTAQEAFYVRCGLGTTMSAQDVAQGRLNIEIGMAIVRPAEFIVLKLSHNLQKS